MEKLGRPAAKTVCAGRPSIIGFSWHVRDGMSPNWEPHHKLVLARATVRASTDVAPRLRKDQLTNFPTLQGHSYILFTLAADWYTLVHTAQSNVQCFQSE